jgi:hypothetical protein
MVHYAGVGATAGILEFMTDTFLNSYHHTFFVAPRSDWPQMTGAQAVTCFAMKDIIQETRVSHINFFILDVEGAEISVLKTIDFEEVMFDVIIVETEELHRPLGYRAKVTAFLRDHNYIRVWCKGRNTWYQHMSFERSSKSVFDPSNSCTN